MERCTREVLDVGLVKRMFRVDNSSREMSRDNESLARVIVKILRHVGDTTGIPYDRSGAFFIYGLAKYVNAVGHKPRPHNKTGWTVRFPVTAEHIIAVLSSNGEKQRYEFIQFLGEQNILPQGDSRPLR